MSEELAEAVGRENPTLLTTNIGSTCYQFLLILINRLRANGHDARLMCKSPGEGQYTPPGFRARTVTGLDGKPYQCSGVSHDAIWSDGQQFDTLVSANEHDRPIYRKHGEPGWSFDPKDGPQFIAIPTWNMIPSIHWRPNNPPLFDDVDPAPVPVPVPRPGAGPGREEMMRAGQWLDGYYRSHEGLQRPQGLSINNAPDWEGVGAWLFDVYFFGRLAGLSESQARAAVVAAIRTTGEWQGKHPGEIP